MFVIFGGYQKDDPIHRPPCPLVIKTHSLQILFIKLTKCRNRKAGLDKTKMQEIAELKQKITDVIVTVDEVKLQQK